MRGACAQHEFAKKECRDPAMIERKETWTRQGVDSAKPMHEERVQQLGRDHVGKLLKLRLSKGVREQELRKGFEDGRFVRDVHLKVSVQSRDGSFHKLHVLHEGAASSLVPGLQQHGCRHEEPQHEGDEGFDVRLQLTTAEQGEETLVHVSTQLSEGDPRWRTVIHASSSQVLLQLASAVAHGSPCFGFATTSGSGSVLRVSKSAQREVRCTAAKNIGTCTMVMMMPLFGDRWSLALEAMRRSRNMDTQIEGRPISHSVDMILVNSFHCSWHSSYTPII